MNVRLLAPEELADLVDKLVTIMGECINAGASVGWVLPYEVDDLTRFWRGIADRAAVSELSAFGAFVDDEIAGVVLLTGSGRTNGPHRAEIQKLLVSPRFRRRWIGRALMLVAEEYAATQGLTLLHLDTAGDDAERLYRALGWIYAGSIPNYALDPDGTPHATALYYRELPSL